MEEFKATVVEGADQLDKEQRKLADLEKQIKKLEIEKQQEMKKVGLTEANLNTMGEANLPKQVKKAVVSLNEKVQQRDNVRVCQERAEGVHKNEKEKYQESKNIIRDD